MSGFVAATNASTDSTTWKPIWKKNVLSSVCFLNPGFARGGRKYVQVYFRIPRLRKFLSNSTSIKVILIELLDSH